MVIFTVGRSLVHNNEIGYQLFQAFIGMSIEMGMSADLLVSATIKAPSLKGSFSAIFLVPRKKKEWVNSLVSTGSVFSTQQARVVVCCCVLCATANNLLTMFLRTLRKEKHGYSTSHGCIRPFKQL
jgi:hypothetical protein